MFQSTSMGKFLTSKQAFILSCQNNEQPRFHLTAYFHKDFCRSKLIRSATNVLPGFTINIKVINEGARSLKESLKYLELSCLDPPRGNWFESHSGALLKNSLSALSELSINCTMAWMADWQVRAMLCATLAES